MLPSSLSEIIEPHVNKSNRRKDEKRDLRLCGGVCFCMQHQLLIVSTSHVFRNPKLLTAFACFL